MPEFILDHGSVDTARAFDQLDAFTRGYIEAMFFTSTGHMEDEDLEHATVADLAPETLERIQTDCARFQAEAAEPLAALPGMSSIAAGRDFWYTRNGHGCGFWDGNWPEPYASTLDKLARQFRGVDLYRGDDERLYLL